MASLHSGPNANHQLTSVRAVSVAEEMNASCRNTMEDAHVTIDNYNGHARQGYFAVYDGHGGRGVVEFIEKVLHINLQQELEEAKTSNRSVEECIKSSFLLTDIQSKEENLLMSGSTAVVCYIQVLEDDATRVLHTANCGDARAVLMRGEKAIRLTVGLLLMIYNLYIDISIIVIFCIVIYSIVNLLFFFNWPVL
jgi:serine/threonine protein phosphatase PrpC